MLDLALILLIFVLLGAYAWLAAALDEDGDLF